MNADTPDTPAAALPAAPAPASTPKPRAGNGLVLLALALAVVALVLCGLLWQRLGFTQEELARRTRDAEAQVVEARTLAAQAEALTQELQARLGVAEVRLSEVSLQRSQLEELMLSLSRSRDDNLVQDLEATLRVALQQAQLTGSAQPLISALQAAEQRIGRAAQPRLNPVQRAIARDIDRIRGAALADIPALAGQLDELVRQVDAWPVANAVGVVAEPAPARPAGKAGGAPATVLPPPADNATDSDAPGAWQAWAARWKAWWAGAIDHSLQQARDLVRVSRIDQPDAALLAPEQAFFLRENLKLQLLNARLALLARQLPASQADVLAVETKLRRYFDTRSPAVAGALTSLGRLRRDLVAQDLPRPDETLAALAAAAGGR
ncbi:MAG: uroporphyrinogen-III C-methyltransferase [Hydrogenophaga sp.]|nr:uroporphyrinogen-III C-methyltransferase [Hydrogenophaga sp.]